jgi:hypothetical protein
MSRNNYDRRAFLRTLGASIALLPMLESERVLASPSAGSGYTGAKRFIVVTQCNGCIAEQFYPTGTGTDLTKLTLPQTTSILADHASDLVMFGNLSWYGGSDKAQLAGVDVSHGAFAQMLSGGNNTIVYNVDPSGFGDAYPAGPTLDQYVAQGLQAQGVKTLLPSLLLSTGCGQDSNYLSRCFFAGLNQGLTPIEDPGIMFDTIFSGGAGGGLSAQQALLRAEQKSILDTVGAQLQAFSKRLGTDDQIRIQAHLQGVRDLESRLTSTSSGAACTKPARPGLGVSGGFVRNDGWERFSDMMNMALLAIQCDATRVVGIQLMDGNGKPIYMPTPIPTKQPDYNALAWGYFNEYHAIAHAAGDPKVECDRFFLMFLDSLLTSLKAIPEGGGTMLDHTVVLWANSFGDGGAHTGPPLPWILAGGAGLGIRTGQYVPGGAIVYELMQTILGVLGMSSNDFGDPKGSKNGIAQLTA